MKSSALQSIFWILFVFCNAVYAQPQSKPTRKEPVSSVSGKVTIKGKAAPGIVVRLRNADFGSEQTSRHKGTTDQDGNYRITNVAAGTYFVLPAAPAFVHSGEPMGKTLIITEGETVEGIDFVLTRGGVITGKAFDSEGLPLIEEQINLVPAEASTQGGRTNIGMPTNVQTDDRGSYRIFGIPPGKYKVTLGESEDSSFRGGPRRSHYKQTFAPGVMDSSRASVIEVTEGSEATNVDITAGRSLSKFTVSGRIINGETQQPLPNIRLSLQKITSDGNFFMNLGSASNGQGDFKLENVVPGKYSIFVEPQARGEIHAESITFEVIDQDVTGLLVKTSEGGSISGVLVLEGRNDKAALALLNQVQIHTYVRNEGPGSFVQPVSVNSDGSFRVGGLQNGVAHFSLNGADRRTIKGLTLLRIERDGVAQPRGLEIKSGEQISGVRLVVRYGNGTVRGVVKIENGELPANARIAVWFTNPGDDQGGDPRAFMPAPEVDSRGHFLVEGLAAGTYMVHASIYKPDSRTRPPSVTQQVNVADGVVSEVTLSLNLEPIPGPGNP